MYPWPREPHRKLKMHLLTMKHNAHIAEEQGMQTSWRHTAHAVATLTRSMPLCATAPPPFCISM